MELAGYKGNPMDPERPSCYLFCSDAAGNEMCNYGYNDCKDGCKKQSCNPCMAAAMAEETLSAKVTERACDSIPQLCCKRGKVNDGSMEWSCYQKPAGGCDQVPENARPWCWEMPHRD